jgi:protein-L-isoaspartate(D-aspartate) O-methyltransferase
MNTFMPLRRGIADDPRVFLPLDEDGHVTLVTNGDQTVDPDALAGVLGQHRAEVWTGVDFRGPETTEWIELYLTCALPNGLSRMPAKRAAIDSGLVSNPSPSATATFDTKGTLAYLTRRKADRTAPDGSTLYEFGVIGHGPDAEARAEHFAQEIRHRDAEYRGQEAAFELQTLQTPRPEARPGRVLDTKCSSETPVPIIRFVLDSTLGRIVIEWM